jgi:protein-arginine kinase activator protein McsA
MKDMDFLIGTIFGIGLSLGYGFYSLHKRNKKERQESIDRLIQRWHSVEHQLTLWEKLNKALESEDYLEAARLRDLIKKQ